MRRFLFRIAAAGTLCLLFVPVSCTKQATTPNQAQPTEKPKAVSEAVKAKRIDELQKAYEGVVALQAATQVGVSYINYGPRLANAATALAIYEPEDDAALAVGSQLQAALDKYVLAGQAWATKFAEYKYSAWVDFEAAHPEVGAASDVDEAVQLLWAKADTHMAAAQAGLAAYKNP